MRSLAEPLHRQGRQLQQENGVTIVRYASDLVSAITFGSQHIEIRAHLDYTMFVGIERERIWAAALFPSSVQTVRGNCSEPFPSDLSLRGPPLKPQRPRQCLVVIIGDGMSLTARDSHNMLIDNIYLRQNQVPDSFSQENTLIGVERAWGDPLDTSPKLWMTNVTIQGHGMGHVRGLRVTSLVHAEDCVFANLGGGVPTVDVRQSASISDDPSEATTASFSRCTFEANDAVDRGIGIVKARPYSAVRLQETFFVDNDATHVLFSVANDTEASGRFYSDEARNVWQSWRGRYVYTRSLWAAEQDGMPFLSSGDEFYRLAVEGKPFDFPRSSGSESASMHAGAIVGIAVGCIAAVLLAISAALLALRMRAHRRRRSHKPMPQQDGQASKSSSMHSAQQHAAAGAAPPRLVSALFARDRASEESCGRGVTPSATRVAVEGSTARARSLTTPRSTESSPASSPSPSGLRGGAGGVGRGRGAPGTTSPLTPASAASPADSASTATSNVFNDDSFTGMSLPLPPGQFAAGTSHASAVHNSMDTYSMHTPSESVVCEMLSKDQHEILSTVKPDRPPAGPDVQEQKAYLKMQLDRMLWQPVLGNLTFVTGRNSRMTGGQAVVQIAEDPSTRVEYAVKFFLSQQVFQQEVALYRDSSQPLGQFLPEVHSIVDSGERGFFDPNGYPMPPCIVMEKGESLDKWAASCTDGLDMVTGLQVLTHIADRLADLHEAGYVHRDIKPANIMWLPRKKRWTLIDFGCAARKGSIVTNSFTPAYAAPEVIRSYMDGVQKIEVSEAMDSWSLGIVALELFTGRPAFSPYQTRAKTLAMISGVEPAPWEAGENRSQILKTLGSLRRPVITLLARKPAFRMAMATFYESCRGVLALTAEVTTHTAGAGTSALMAGTTGPLAGTAPLAGTGDSGGTSGGSTGRDRLYTPPGLDAGGGDPRTPTTPANATDPLAAPGARAPAQASGGGLETIVPAVEMDGGQSGEMVDRSGSHDLADMHAMLHRRGSTPRPGPGVSFHYKTTLPTVVSGIEMR